MKEDALDITLEQIGEKLSALRIKKGYASIKDFANDHHLPLIQYWRMEKGKANITMKSLMRLLEIHEVEMQDFFCGTMHEREGDGHLREEKEQ